MRTPMCIYNLYRTYHKKEIAYFFLILFQIFLTKTILRMNAFNLSQFLFLRKKIKCFVMKIREFELCKNYT